MPSIIRSNLGKRILLLVFVSMLFMLAAFVISGWLAINQTLDRLQSERQALVLVIGRYLDRVLQQNLVELENFRFAPGVDLEDGSLDAEKNALHNIYLYSMFDTGVFITDKKGVIVLNYPVQPDLLGSTVSSNPSVAQSLVTDRTAITTTLEPGLKRNTITIATPIHGLDGSLYGVICGQMNPEGKTLSEVIHLIRFNDNSHIDIIDSSGRLIISSETEIQGDTPRSGLSHNEVSVMTDLAYAPWTVALRLDEATAYGPLREMQQRLLVFGFFTLIFVLVFSWGMTRSIIRPLAKLSDSANAIAHGDLSETVPETSDDEIGQLSRSFDTMRRELKKSLDQIQGWSRDLETKVQNRTRQLQDSYKEIERKDLARSELLSKFFSAQEEERKRIARELHDETSQSLNGLVMRVEAALALPDDSVPKLKEMLAMIKNLSIRTVDGVHKIIFDLRPTLLDDLGLLSALRWYVDNRLKEKDIEVRIELTGEERKLPPTTETAVFRVVQEAISNILRHSEAQHVLFSMEYKSNSLNLEIEDDGKGFVVEEFASTANVVQGLGLLGMKERITLLGGSLNIESQPGKGTHIYILVPFV